MKALYTCAADMYFFAQAGPANDEKDRITWPYLFCTQDVMAAKNGFSAEGLFRHNGCSKVNGGPS